MSLFLPAIGIAYIMIFDFLYDCKPYRLVKMCEILMKLNRQASMKTMWFTTEYKWNWSKPHIHNIIQRRLILWLTFSTTTQYITLAASAEFIYIYHIFLI